MARLEAVRKLGIARLWDSETLDCKTLDRKTLDRKTWVPKSRKATAANSPFRSGRVATIADRKFNLRQIKQDNAAATGCSGVGSATSVSCGRTGALEGFPRCLVGAVECGARFGEASAQNRPGF
jgi:hypothetical protein